MSSKQTPKLPSHSGMSPGGSVPPQFNPHYEVPDQGEPTVAEPVARRKHARGMTGGGQIETNLPSFK